MIKTVQMCVKFAQKEPEINVTEFYLIFLFLQVLYSKYLDYLRTVVEKHHFFLEKNDIHR